MNNNIDEQGQVSIRDLVNFVWSNRWKVILITFAIFILSSVGIIVRPPQYQATALIQVENQRSGLDMLQGLGLMNNLMGKTTAALPSQIESTLMQSRYILLPVIQKYHLDYQVRPKLFPIFGGYLAHRFQGAGVANALLGFSSDAWGGEQLELGHFDVPGAYYYHSFELRVGKKGHYTLYSPDGSLLLHGTTGYDNQTHSGLDPHVFIHVNHLKARPGTYFYLTREPLDVVLNSLKAHFKVEDQNVGAAGQATGVLRLVLTGTDAAQLPTILNAIIKVEVQKNIQKKTAEAQQTIAFLNKQLPAVKKSLTRAEDRLTAYRARTRSLGISLEGKTLLDQLVNLEQLKEKLHLQKSELLLHFTSRHPLVIAVTNKEKQLAKQLSLLSMKISMLPKKEQKAVSLERDVKVKNQMYLLMLSKLQELDVAKAGMISDVTVLGRADAIEVIPQHKKLLLMASLIFGFMFSIFVLLVFRLFKSEMLDPDAIEQYLKLPVLGLIPFSKRQSKLFQAMKKNYRENATGYELARHHPSDLAIEGLRSLRTTLQFSTTDLKNNVISIMGAQPSIGKSFVSANLAHVLAEDGKKILLIDGDMRRGRLYRYFGSNQTPGLVDVLTDRLALKDVLQPVADTTIDFIATGKYPAHASASLLQGQFIKFLDQVASQYDTVIIDTPPILALTDASMIAHYAGTNLLLTGMEKDSVAEVNHAIKRLAVNNVKLAGLVLNEVAPHETYSYVNYHYYYEYGLGKKRRRK